MLTLHACHTAGSFAGLFGADLLDEDCLRLLAVKEVSTLEREIRAFTAAIGFERYGAVVLRDDFSSEDSCVQLAAIHNSEPAYLETWDDAGMARTDPVSQHCKRSSIPVAYNQQSYVSVGAGERWEQ
ncbi:MAG: autoinducer binding domain-containing protein [Caldimonas sp.]